MPALIQIKCRRQETILQTRRKRDWVPTLQARPMPIGRRSGGHLEDCRLDDPATVIQTVPAPQLANRPVDRHQSIAVTVIPTVSATAPPPLIDHRHVAYYDVCERHHRSPDRRATCPWRAVRSTEHGGDRPPPSSRSSSGSSWRTTKAPFPRPPPPLRLPSRGRALIQINAEGSPTVSTLATRVRGLMAQPSRSGSTYGGQGGNLHRIDPTQRGSTRGEIAAARYTCGVRSCGRSRCVAGSMREVR